MGISARIVPFLKASLGSASLAKNPLPRLTKHLDPVACATRVRTLPFRVWFENFQPATQYYASRLGSKFTAQIKSIYCLCPSGKRLCTRNFLGVSVAVATTRCWPTTAHAMEGSDAYLEQNLDGGDPYYHLKEDLYNVWELLKKFQIPGILLLMVYLGWRHPLTLLINIVLLLSCTRPSPYSVYMFIEELRSRAMRQNPGLSKLKLCYVRTVGIQDYRLLCLVDVELRDRRLRLIGILGSWWVVHSSAI